MSKEKKEIVKQYEMTEEQHRRLFEDMDSIEALNRRLPELIAGIHGEIKEKREKLFNEAARLMGYPNHFAIFKSGHTLNIDWRTGIITLMKEEATDATNQKQK